MLLAVSSGNKNAVNLFKQEHFAVENVHAEEVTTTTALFDDAKMVYKCTHEPIDFDFETPQDDTPESIILAIWASVRRDAANVDWTLVDCGINKGYTVASLLTAIGVPKKSGVEAGLSVVNFAKRKNASVANRGGGLCGVSCQCVEDNPKPGVNELLSSHELHRLRAFLTSADGGNRGDELDKLFMGEPHDFRLYGLDPIQDHVEHADEFCNSGPPLASLHDQGTKKKVRTRQGTVLAKKRCFFRWAAASRAPGRAKFLQCAFGEESCSLDSSTSNSHFVTKEVDVIALGPWLTKEHRVRHVDVMVTDTEGFDTEVFFGAAQELFAQGAVSLYVFEFKGPNPKLRDHIEFLETGGRGSSALQLSDRPVYQCYLYVRRTQDASNSSKMPPQSRQLVRVSSACWQQELEQLRHANYVCVYNGKHRDVDLRWAVDTVARRPPTVSYCELSRLHIEKRRNDLDFDWMFASV